MAEKKTEKKITKTMRNIDAIALLLHQPAPNGSTVEDVIEHLNHENELLARKNSSNSKKPTKAQQEDAKLKDDVIAFLCTVEKGVTATEVMEACGLKSNQKATALLRALVKTGEVVNEKVGKKSLFSLSGVVETADESEAEAVETADESEA